MTRTDPKAGAQVKADQPITIYVSTGPPIVSVPSVPQGTPQSDAEATLHKAKFKTSSTSSTATRSARATSSPSTRATRRASSA